MTKQELQAALDELTAKDQVEPPTVAEMLAYRDGELSAEDEERVREQLSRWPEMVRALMTPYPSDDAKPGDPDYLPLEIIERQWRCLSPEPPKE